MSKRRGHEEEDYLQTQIIKRRRRTSNSGGGGDNKRKRKKDEDKYDDDVDQISKRMNTLVVDYCNPHALSHCEHCAAHNAPERQNERCQAKCGGISQCNRKIVRNRLCAEHLEQCQSMAVGDCGLCQYVNPRHGPAANARCKATCMSTGQQCWRYRFYGSKYCWQHNNNSN